MIFKSYDINKSNISKYNLFLFYGENQGLKEEIIEKNFKDNYLGEVLNYTESEILKNEDNFYNNILSNSFFNNEKLIIIKRTSDKILNIIEKKNEKNLDNLKIILDANILEKKSKMRKFFEKEKKTICVPFYEDNQKALLTIAVNFFKQNKINISPQNINLIIDRCNGDRINLNNELKKIQNYMLNKSTINTEEILKLTNLADNFSASELVDNSLAKNKKKTLYILNENNFASDDCIQIVRIYLSKLKRLLNIKSETTKNNNIEQVISSYKPPIFWKEKDIVKQQIEIWNSKKIENLIMDTNELEYQIKKNPNASTLLVTNFILEKTLETNNSL